MYTSIQQIEIYFYQVLIYNLVPAYYMSAHITRYHDILRLLILTQLNCQCDVYVAWWCINTMEKSAFIGLDNDLPPIRR